MKSVCPCVHHCVTGCAQVCPAFPLIKKFVIQAMVTMHIYHHWNKIFIGEDGSNSWSASEMVCMGGTPLPYQESPSQNTVPREQGHPLFWEHWQKVLDLNPTWFTMFSLEAGYCYCILSLILSSYGVFIGILLFLRHGDVHPNPGPTYKN